MIRISQPKKPEKENWHVAITRNSGGYYNFHAAEDVERFRYFVEKMGLDIVAEQEGLTEGDMDRIIGYKLIPTDDGFMREDNAVKVGTESLANLIDRLNQDRSLDPQTELKKLYNMVHQKP